MPDLLGNGANTKKEYRSLPLPRGGSCGSCHWAAVILFILVLVEIAARCCVLAVSCSYLEYNLDNVSTPPAAFECLKLTRHLSSQICNKQIKARTTMIRRKNIRLHFCSSYPMYSLIRATDRDHPCIIGGSIQDCTNCFERLLEIDQEVAQSIAVFRDLVDRVDCDDQYSVKWNCTHCQIAYKEWLCATKFKYYHDQMDQPVPPCGDFCSRVEKMCPFFRPDNDDTHAGDPSFICKDPEIASKSMLYGEPPGCYKLCHLVADVGEVFHSAHDEHCHKIDLSNNYSNNNNNVTVGNHSHATASSSAARAHQQSPFFVILYLLLLVSLRTMLPQTSIGLT